MKKVMFWTFTAVYAATAAATLVAFLAQARLIPTNLGANEEIPHLGLLIGAVLVETVGGYLALAKNLFGLKYSESEEEIRKLANTVVNVLHRLQTLAHLYSAEFQKVVEQLKESAAGRWLGNIGLDTVSERNKTILEVTKSIEEALREAEVILLTDDVGKISVLNSRVASVLPKLEAWLYEERGG